MPPTSKYEPSSDLASEREFAAERYTMRQTFRRLGPILRPDALRLVLAAGLIAVVGVAVALVPLFPKYVVDGIGQSRPVTDIAWIAGLFLLSQSLRMGLWYIAMRWVLFIKERMLYTLRSQAFSHLQRLCLRFHNRYPSGFLYDRVFGNAIALIGNVMQMLFQQLAVSLSGLVFSLIFCFWLSPQMTVVVLVGAIGYVVAGKLLGPRIYQRTKETVNQQSKVTEFIMDRLRGTRTIQALALEDRMQSDFEARAWEVQMRSFRATMENTKLGFVTEGWGYILTAGIWVLGAYLILGRNNTSVGTLVAFMGYQNTLIWMVASLTNVYGQFVGAQAAFDQLFTILDTPSSVVDAPGNPMPSPIAGRLTFQNVSFSYAPGKPVLQDINLDFPAGQTIALVGRSGSGKTTLANLLLRFYDPDQGVVQLDGHDIRELPLRQYRPLFGVVLQDPYLFDATVADNMRFARPDATEADIWQALEDAQAAAFVRTFPRGLETRIGEGGVQVSGGQRQRLAIARCLVMRSRVIILDEPTSALDSESERLIGRALETMSRERTVFIIAHRLATIRRAGRILVMEQGRVVQDGAFEDLVNREGVFRNLYNVATSTSSRGLKIEEAGFA